MHLEAGLTKSPGSVACKTPVFPRRLRCMYPLMTLPKDGGEAFANGRIAAFELSSFDKPAVDKFMRENFGGDSTRDDGLQSKDHATGTGTTPTLVRLKRLATTLPLGQQGAIRGEVAFAAAKELVRDEVFT